MSTVITKLILTLQTDTETGETTVLNREVVNDDIKKPAKKAKVEENPEPIITLDPNKLIFTTGAIELLGVCSDCRVDIKYDKQGQPVVGTNEAFGTVGGNRLTKSNTVSFRGKANEKLQEFGTTFKLEPSEKEGIFKMIGDKVSAADIPEELVDIEAELDDLDNLDLIDDTNTNFDFTL